MVSNCPVYAKFHKDRFRSLCSWKGFERIDRHEQENKGEKNEGKNFF